MVIFDEVSMSYSGAEEAISNISFVVKRGETVGVDRRNRIREIDVGQSDPRFMMSRKDRYW